jgi:hypothetical protein
MTTPLYPCPLFTFVLSNIQSHSPLHALPLPLIHLTTEVLVLRLAPAKKKKNKKGVQWAEDVVDNEFMNKKSSKSKFVHLVHSVNIHPSSLSLSLSLSSNPLFRKPMQNVVYFINKGHLETGVMVRIVMQNVMSVAKVIMIMLVIQNHLNNHDEQ